MGKDQPHIKRDPYIEGWEAQQVNTENPYPRGSKDSHWWAMGFLDAVHEHQQTELTWKQGRFVSSVSNVLH